jgi:hypothetical protein
MVKLPSGLLGEEGGLLDNTHTHTHKNKEREANLEINNADVQSRAPDLMKVAASSCDAANQVRTNVARGEGDGTET